MKNDCQTCDLQTASKTLQGEGGCRNKPPAVQVFVTCDRGRQTQHSKSNTHLHLGFHHLYTVLVQVLSFSASQLLVRNLQRKIWTT